MKYIKIQTTKEFYLQKDSVFCYLDSYKNYPPPPPYRPRLHYISVDSFQEDLPHYIWDLKELPYFKDSSLNLIFSRDKDRIEDVSEELE